MRKSSAPASKKDKRFLVNKDPFYRTNDILGGAFRKKVRLLSGKTSMTNCKDIIWVNFEQFRLQSVEFVIETTEDNREIYMLRCGHEFRGAQNKNHPIGKVVPCFQCGAKDAYRSFEHEWSHVIFKSNPFLVAKFIEEYKAKLASEGYDVHRIKGLSEFLFWVVNAFDDIRVTSLWELVYPGSAYEIWEKWKYVCEQNDLINENFIAFIFGIALEAENLNTQEGPFKDIIPVVLKATKMVRGKGPANMLLAVRWMLDRCVKKLLDKTQQPPEDQNQEDCQSGQQQQQQDQGQQDNDQVSASGDGEQDPGDEKQDQRHSREEDHSEGDDSEEGDTEDQESGADKTSDQKDTGQQSGPKSTSGEDRKDRKDDQKGSQQEGEKSADEADAMNYLIENSSTLDTGQDHPVPDLDMPKDVDEDSTANRAAIHHALSQDIDDDQVSQDLSNDAVDQDVQNAVDTLKSAAQPKDSHGFLLSNAKANIAVADVQPSHIYPNSRITLSDEDRYRVVRMRAAFARVMGREKHKMDSEGVIVDIQSAIQNRIDPSEDSIFENEVPNKGFAYMTLCDMSGSMSGDRFNQVCVGSEMLKKALDYPFVEGHLWGFRGAIDYNSSGSFRSTTKGGQVWVFRYSDECDGYLGGPINGKNNSGQKSSMDLSCNGLTPMNTAIHVAAKYLHTHVPQGMAKKLFLLTDGDPTQFTTKGRVMSDEWLMGLVGKEIQSARQKGIDVYTFIIGRDITDRNAIRMFGHRKMWTRISQDRTIGKALVDVITKEFVSYLNT